ncbi:MAG: hypothetical protein QM809_15315 [Gordonia sp. (in: high G+C Gram-positive bacteria)]|uniref:hypothetical protein n=1 Tax=Gordonia sp. (in: high G+C Gram-positive bacteria) TaxID=84139 RepID=UPI0039E5CB70
MSPSTIGSAAQRTGRRLLPESRTLIIAGVSLSAFTASTGWLAEKLFDKSIPVAWAASGITLLLWIVMIRWAGRLRADTGTLYYLRLQPTGHVPRHDLAATLTSKDARDFRAVRRTHAAIARNATEVDLLGPTADLYTEFERSTNDDDDSTLFEIAPDLPWPVALRVGFDWTPRHRVRMIELAEQGGSSHTRWSLDSERESLVLGRSPMTARTHPSRFGPIVIAAGARSSPPNTDRPRTAPEVRRVRVALFATPNGLPVFTADPDSSSDSRSRVPIRPGEPEYDVTHIVYCGDLESVDSPPSTPPGSDSDAAGTRSDQRRVRLKGMSYRDGVPVAVEDLGEDEDSEFVDGNTLTDSLVWHIHAVFAAFPDARIDITARVPKTIAFSLGVALGRYSAPPFDVHPHLAAIWERGRFMDYANGVFVPALVHPAQRSPT